MERKISWLALAGLAIAPAVQAQEAAEFTPSSVWAADYGDDYCRLVRSFSDGKDEITVMLQRVQPGADTQLIVVGDALRTFRGANEISWHFLPNQAERKGIYLRSEAPDGQQFLRFDNVTFAAPVPMAPGAAFQPPAPYDRAAEQQLGKDLTGLLFSAGLTKPVRVETGRLDAVIGALQACTDDLLASWGLDAEKHKALSMPAIPQFSPDGWLPGGTIPFSEFGKFAGGANQVRLMLDTSGKPTGCHIFGPTLSDDLNKRICELLMEKAAFTPAKDAGGQPVASFWMGSPMFLGPPMPGFGGPGGGRRGG